LLGKVTVVDVFARTSVLGMISVPGAGEATVTCAASGCALTAGAEA